MVIKTFKIPVVVKAGISLNRGGRGGGRTFGSATVVKFLKTANAGKGRPLGFVKLLQENKSLTLKGIEGGMCL